MTPAAPRPLRQQPAFWWTLAGFTLGSVLILLGIYLVIGLLAADNADDSLPAGTLLAGLIYVIVQGAALVAALALRGRQRAVAAGLLVGLVVVNVVPPVCGGAIILLLSTIYGSGPVLFP